MFRKEGNGMEAESGIKAQHTVLVVADDRRVLLLAQAVLARKGHRVLLASDSQRAIELLSRACDTKVERREKLKESRKILAYPYCRPLGEPRRARGDALPGRRRSRAPRFCTLRPLRKTSVWLVFIGVHRRPIWGFRIRVGPGKKHIWPLRSGGSSGVAGISTFISRTRRKSEASRGSAPPGNSSLRRHRCRRYNRVLRRSVQTVPDRNHRVVEFTVENYGQNGAVDAFA